MSRGVSIMVSLEEVWEETKSGVVSGELNIFSALWHKRLVIRERIYELQRSRGCLVWRKKSS